MTNDTPAHALFDEVYRTRTAPWVIGEPQPAIVGLERAGRIRGRVLDVGCGTGEHTILLAGLGYDVLGVDYSARAVEQARDNAAARAVEARFDVADALDPGSLSADGQRRFDTIVDSALFHIFDDADRPRYVRSLHAVCRPGAVVHVLALSDAGRGFGPQVSAQTLRRAFTDGWRLEAIDTTIYRGVVTENHAQTLGLPVGERVDEPAWLVRVHRI